MNLIHQSLNPYLNSRDLSQFQQVSTGGKEAANCMARQKLGMEDVGCGFENTYPAPNHGEIDNLSEASRSKYEESQTKNAINYVSILNRIEDEGAREKAKNKIQKRLSNENLCTGGKKHEIKEIITSAI